MTGVHFVLALNIAVALLFAGAYAAVALTLPAQRKALWLALAYFCGMLQPLNQALVPFVGHVVLLEWIGYGGFTAATALVVVGLRVMHGLTPQWRWAAGFVALSLVMRAILFNFDRTGFWHGVAYQAPFAIGSAAGCIVAARLPARGPIGHILTGLFGALALQFAAKPFWAQMFGAGRTLADYTNSWYALVSQAGTGIIMMALGLTLLLSFVHQAMAQSNALAETDPLTGLLNRRGFERRATALIAALDPAPVGAILFDLDHFKQVNDRFGHDAGDRLLVGFAMLLGGAAHGSSLAARLGGEEFVMLVPGDGAARLAEAIRARTAGHNLSNLPPVTVSAGVAERHANESLANLLRRADEAAYAAKRAGRDRVVQADAPALTLAA